MLSKKISSLTILFAVIALIGFADATYLTISHYADITVPCGTGIFSDCGKVTSSVYASIFGIPLALFGALYYVTNIVLAVLTLDSKNTKWIRWAGYFSTVGLVTSATLVYLMFFVIKALCLYCFVSALSSTLLFALGMYMVRLVKHDESLRMADNRIAENA